MSNKIYPCLWFDGQAKAAAAFYAGIFPNSKVLSDSGMVVMFEVMGQKIMGLNGGPKFQLTEAFSFVVQCEDQKEIDHYWNSLIANGGKESMCGWLKDPFGVSWQIIPVSLSKLMSNPATSGNVMQALLKMKKLDLATLEKAAQNE
jgi:predicted 3-demethylubiquinone-9 3-methyltransferase (glyoxalase superfamily)